MGGVLRPSRWGTQQKFLFYEVHVMIVFNEAEKIFTLFTPHTCYQMKVDAQDRLLHTWYGRRPENAADCPA